MKEYFIIHAKQGNFFANNIKKSDCQTVAILEAESLEEAYRLSQNIDTPWINGSKVTKKMVEQARSTSVGDIIKEIGHEGVPMMVANIGFEEVELKNNTYKKVK